VFLRSGKFPVILTEQGTTEPVLGSARVDSDVGDVFLLKWTRFQRTDKLYQALYPRRQTPHNHCR
jgi:hypothetical protein